MTLELRKVTRDDLSAIMKLSVRADQDNFVAPNSVTVAQASFEPGSTVYGIWEGGVVIGLMAVIHMPDYPWPEDADDKDSLYLWRLMIDKDHQNAGHGRATLNLLVNLAHEFGRPRVTTSVVQHEDAALKFYEKFGFQQTGDILDDEIVLVLTV